MSSLKPIKLYSHAKGPNPWKVAIVLEELGVPYENEVLADAALKQEPFLSINPNGRVPAIEDPNTGYDKEHKISYSTKPEKYHTDQWLFFQVSGQGPYFGQYSWFNFIHPEKIPSAIERYEKEIRRIISVIDLHLTKVDTPYLVGDKCTYADLSFVTWSVIVAYAGLDVYEGGTKNQRYKAWLERLMARETVQKVFADQERAKNAH